MIKNKPQLLGRQLWCYECLKKRPPRIQPSDYLVLLRDEPYGLTPDGSAIDKSVVGICSKCLEDKGSFKKSSKQPVNINHPDLVYSGS